MDRRKDIILRVNLMFIIIVLVGISIVVRAFYIQQIQGQKWKTISTKTRESFREIIAKRGDIYNEEGELLSTTIPTFDIYVDFNAKGLKANDGELFNKYYDSLCLGLSKIFPDSSLAKFKHVIKKEFNDENGFYPLLKGISFRQYQAVKQLPLVRLGKNKSGFIDSIKNTRLNPYKMYGQRTIGIARDAKPIGLELSYDSILKGHNGKEYVRFVRGIAIPIENTEQVEAENGKDIVSTLNVFMQQVADNALKEMLEQNNSEYGTAIVMETETGKIKALANIGRDIKNDSSRFAERDNYALYASEPGSTFKLATLIALFEDKKVDMNSTVNLRRGEWEIVKGSLVVKDSEKHDRTDVSVKQAFALSSNVGMASLIFSNYRNNPNEYINKLGILHCSQKTNIDLIGESNPYIPNPKDKEWNLLSTLPWMAFGYNLRVTPLQTINLYNAIANNGKMLKPYLISSIKDEGLIVEERKPSVVVEKICSESTLKQVKECLNAVCNEEGGTGYTLFKNSPYKVAGKTGTNKINDGIYVYNDNVYQSSFVGYFPAEKPKYTICVVIRNTKASKAIYGAAVAGPVFKKIADRFYSRFIQNDTTSVANQKVEKSQLNALVYYKDYSQIKSVIPFAGSSTASNNAWVNINDNSVSGVNDEKYLTPKMPSLKGLSAKDAIYVCESKGLKVKVRGYGKVMNQTIEENQPVIKGSTIQIILN